MPDCNKLARGKGEIIPCMVENRSNITDASCQQFVKKMASIIFSDYRLICRFADRCKADIEKHKCGRLHAEGDDVSLFCIRLPSCIFSLHPVGSRFTFVGTNTICQKKIKKHNHMNSQYFY